MFISSHLFRNLLWVLFLTMLATPAQAHKVQVAEDVGGTLHIEPNDTPRAGESALAWFALTRKGGQVIPLNQCNCQLSVYTEPSTASSPPLLKPTLKAVSAEQYQGIPGAEIQFPQPGAYQLQLSGTPTSGGNFKPFQLNFQVTVAAGAPATATNPQATQSPTPNLPTPVSRRTSLPWQLPVIALSTALTIGVLWSLGRKEHK